MKWLPVFGLILLALSPFARADTPIGSIDGFEGHIRQCLLQGDDPPECLGETMRGHFSPGNERLNKVVDRVAGLFGQWLADDDVFALHPVKRKRLGDFYEERVYLIEDTTGSLVMLETSFVNTLGKWYLHRFNLSSKEKTMESVLGVDL